ncbi:hypothetical protein FKP32DRAFT_495055 [Trametes sanguinea]|nr:hypothetical protein FKP32DRAFT_495055 [Trametes sanguinea]
MLPCRFWKHVTDSNPPGCLVDARIAWKSACHRRWKVAATERGLRMRSAVSLFVSVQVTTQNMRCIHKSASWREPVGHNSLARIAHPLNARPAGRPSLPPPGTLECIVVLTCSSQTLPECYLTYATRAGEGQVDCTWHCLRHPGLRDTRVSALFALTFHGLASSITGKG